MMKRKVKKTRKMRGTRYHGYAAKKHKGKGNKGGKGMAGSGKKADQKKSYVLKYHHPYFGRKGFTSRSTVKKKNKVINIEDLNKYDGEANLPIYKILSKGELQKKLVIRCKAISKKAREKIEKVGGKIELVGEKTEKQTKNEKKSVEK